MDKTFLTKFSNIYVMGALQVKEIMCTKDISSVFMNIQEKEYNIICMKEYGNH
jgi:hypothetical protein